MQLGGTRDTEILADITMEQPSMDPPCLWDIQAGATYAINDMISVAVGGRYVWHPTAIQDHWM